MRRENGNVEWSKDRSREKRVMAGESSEKRRSMLIRSIARGQSSGGSSRVMIGPHFRFTVQPDVRVKPTTAEPIIYATLN